MYHYDFDKRDRFRLSSYGSLYSTGENIFRDFDNKYDCDMLYLKKGKYLITLNAELILGFDKDTTSSEWVLLIETQSPQFNYNESHTTENENNFIYFSRLINIEHEFEGFEVNIDGSNLYKVNYIITIMKLD